MSNCTGNVVEVFEKNGIYAIKMDDGGRYGFYKTDMRQYSNKKISFSWIQKGDFRNGDAKTIEVLGDANSSVHSNSSSSVPIHAGSTTTFRQGDTQIAIQYQASRNAAIALVTAALAAGAVALPAKKADQFDAILGLVDFVAARYHTKTTAVVQSGGVDDELSDNITASGNDDEAF